MFNLTVDEAHTFYVGENGWLVHNQNKYASFSSNWGSFSAADSIKAIGADVEKYTLNTDGTKKLFVSADGLVA
ncbi:hypothetical protein [Deinococcus sp.]|uniref:hypothetical protein n=1 Tax=Deinococcus sp. TaxID=47478 RepID=UPI003C7C1648